MTSPALPDWDDSPEDDQAEPDDADVSNPDPDSLPEPVVQP
jgi:hypothetical protein